MTDYFLFLRFEVSVQRQGAAMLDKPDRSKSQRAAPKLYERPTLAKGPVLTSVTALGVVSGKV